LTPEEEKLIGVLEESRLGSEDQCQKEMFDALESLGKATAGVAAGLERLNCLLEDGRVFRPSMFAVGGFSDLTDLLIDSRC
jgi:hypothetical protein